MAADKEKYIAYRCPVCFAREIDVVLHKRENQDFYCVKCSFTGNLDDIKKMYDDQKKKYHLMTKRIKLEDFNGS